MTDCNSKVIAEAMQSRIESFIEKAKIVHGDRYDYSSVTDINSKAKVKITCREHGVFEQTIYRHLQGRGCSRCSGNTKPFSEIVVNFRKVHGDKYDYSQAVYINAKTKIKIICPVHGGFWQTPSNHMKHGGCYECVGMSKVGVPLKWLEEHKNHRFDECLIWPFSRNLNGYGQVRYKGRSRLASRVMCMFAHGKPRSNSLEAAHSCGKGHKGCVNPKHLRWDTPKGNCLDKLQHGTDTRGEKNWNAKLNIDAVREIRRTYSCKNKEYLAEKFGVHATTIRDVFKRRTWAWLE